MYFLAFETSCDDTSIALFHGGELVSMKTRSQIHDETQGVVPEVAARLHANAIFTVLEEVLSEANVTLEQIDFLACTEKPGLLPSLLVGKTVTKTLGYILKKPVLWIDHIEAHIFANLLERDIQKFQFPAVCLTVSGGHNELYLWKSLFDLELLGQTRDDAAGEAFDKVAKAMGYGFPGGPTISRLASEYDGKSAHLFPRPYLEKDSLEFSFSGLKSAVKREVDLSVVDGKISIEDQRRIAFEFQEAIIDTLVEKLFRAAYQTGVKRVVLAGGVSANDLLRSRIAERAEQE